MHTKLYENVVNSHYLNLWVFNYSRKWLQWLLIWTISCYFCYLILVNPMLLTTQHLILIDFLSYKTNHYNFTVLLFMTWKKKRNYSHLTEEKWLLQYNKPSETAICIFFEESNHLAMQATIICIMITTLLNPIINNMWPWNITYTLY